MTTTTSAGEELDALRDMAAEQGFRLVPIHSQDAHEGQIPPPHPDKLADMQRRLVWLDSALKQAVAAAKAHKAERAVLEEAMLEKMAEEGMTSLTVDGMNAFLRSTYSLAKLDPDTDPSDIIKALEASGLGHVVGETYNYQSLLATIKEIVLDASGNKVEDLPEPLAELMEFNTGHQIITGVAGRKRSGGRSTG